jgi:hypothetical protein
MLVYYQHWFLDSKRLTVLPFTITSLLTYMTLAVFVKRSIKKNVRGVRDDGGNWWKGGGVGEAVLGGDGDEAADPCRVMLKRPWEAGEISKISLAVIACSAKSAS